MNGQIGSKGDKVNKTRFDFFASKKIQSTNGSKFDPARKWIFFKRLELSCWFERVRICHTVWNFHIQRLKPNRPWCCYLPFYSEPDKFILVEFTRRIRGAIWQERNAKIARTKLQKLGVNKNGLRFPFPSNNFLCSEEADSNVGGCWSRISISIFWNFDLDKRANFTLRLSSFFPGCNQSRQRNKTWRVANQTPTMLILL